MSDLSFLPSTLTETVTLVASFLLGALALWLVARISAPMDIPGGPGPDDTYLVKLTEWERERALSTAKGLATSASGFFVAVVVALLKDEVTSKVSALSLIGCLLGSIGVLMMATNLSLTANRSAIARLRPTKTEETLTW